MELRPSDMVHLESVKVTQMVQVVAAIISDGVRILACRRASHKAAAGKWEFPGGKVEPGELPHEAIMREIYEELGAEIDVRGLLLREKTEVDGEVIDLTFFGATFRGHLPVLSTDHDELRWLPVDQIERLDWALPDLPAVRWLQAQPV